MKMFEDAIKRAKEVVPEFDENNPEHLDNVAKALCLTINDEELYKHYLDSIVKPIMKERFEKVLKDAPANFERVDLIEAEKKKLLFEKRIIDAKIEVLKDFMN